MQGHDERWLQSKIYSRWMVVLSTICLTALLATLGLGVTRVHMARMSKKKWGARRRRLVTITLLQVILQVAPRCCCHVMCLLSPA